MKAELQAAVDQLKKFAEEARVDDLPLTHAQTMVIVNKLLPILERAKLMEELWAAATGRGNARSQREVLSTLVKMDVVCRKVSKTET